MHHAFAYALCFFMVLVGLVYLYGRSSTPEATKPDQDQLTALKHSIKELKQRLKELEERPKKLAKQGQELEDVGIELAELLRMFMLPAGVTYNVIGWSTGSAANTPIK